MDFSRPLLLKGLAGVAAIGTIGGVGVVYREDIGNLFKTKEQLEKIEEDRKARGEVNEKLGSLGLEGDCLVKDGEDPSKAFPRECPLNLEKLKKIKFSNRGEGEVKVSGEVPENLKLKIDGTKEDFSFYFTGIGSSPIAIIGDKSKGKIILKSSTPEQKFKEKDGSLEKDSSGVDADLKAKLEEFNKQLETVNAPVECRFDETEKEESFECPITEGELKGLEFSNKEDGNLTVKDWPSSGGVKLKVERNDKEDISLYFTGVTSDIKVFGDKTKRKIIIKNAGGSNKKFKVIDGKLTKDSSGVDATLKTKLEELNKQLEKVNAPLECRFDEVENEASFECPVTEGELKGLIFSNKGTGDHKVVGWNGNTNVKLKVEKDAQNAMSLSFQNVTSDIKVFGDKKKGKILLKSDGGSNKKFKVEGEKLTKGTSNEQLKELNEQLGTINVPLECRFDEVETEASVECDVTPDDLKTMMFKKDQGDLTYSSGQNFTGMKLKVQIIKTTDSKDGEKISDMFLTFKDYDKTVKLMKGEEEIVSLIKGTNPEFEIKAENVGETTFTTLGKELDPEDLLGLTCTNEEDQTEGNCTFTENDGEKKIKVGKGTDEPVELTITDTNSNIFVLHKDQENYNQGYKFVFKGKTISGAGGSPSLVEGKEYEFRWKHQDGTKVGYLVKKN